MESTHGARDAPPQRTARPQASEGRDQLWRKGRGQTHQVHPEQQGAAGDPSERPGRRLDPSHFTEVRFSKHSPSHLLLPAKEDVLAPAVFCCGWRRCVPSRRPSGPVPP